LKKRIFYITTIFVYLIFGKQNVSVLAQKVKKDVIIGSFEVPTSKIDYANQANWIFEGKAAFDKDSLPKGLSETSFDTSQVDIFFIYPTIYYGEPNKQNPWLANINDPAHKSAIVSSTIKHQSSVFWGLGKIYCPYYRQAHISAFYNKNEHSKKALDFAYNDLKAAFEYYLKYHNKGRPIIIAGHSQGSFHGMQLLKDYFDEKPLQKQLVFAYLIGYPMAQNEYKSIPLAQNALQTGAFASWNTYAKGFKPDWHNPTKAIAASTNPLTWKTDSQKANYDQNLGAVDGKFNIIKNGSNAQNVEGLLWIDKLNIRGAAFIRTKVWHHADYNLFWVNIRENCKTRINSYLNK
jgi:hypothetical protein